ELLAPASARMEEGIGRGVDRRASEIAIDIEGRLAGDLGAIAGHRRALDRDIEAGRLGELLERDAEALALGASLRHDQRNAYPVRMTGFSEQLARRRRIGLVDDD